jgi:hypothetical protein
MGPSQKVRRRRWSPRPATLAGTTLVCWQHETIPTIAASIMGNAVGLPAAWPGDRFDVVWRFTRASAGAPWSFDQVCERLLPGDSARPIEPV